MKKMLKYLLTFIFTFVLIGQVNALEVNYEWGKEFTDLQTIYGMYPDEEGFVLDIADINWDYYLDLYDDNLEFIEEYDYDKSCSLYLPSTEIEGETYLLNVYNYYSAPAPISSQNVVDSRADIGNHHDIRLLDENCEEVDSVSIEYSGNYFYAEYLNELEEEYVIIDEYFYRIIVVDKEFENAELFYLEDLSDRELKELLGDYYYPYITLVDDDYDYFLGVTINASGYALLEYDTPRRNDEYDYHYVLINLEDGSYEEYVIKNYYEIYDSAAVLRDDELFVIEEIIDDDNFACFYDSPDHDENDDRDYCYSQYLLKVFDLDMNVIYEKELQLVESDYIDFMDYYGRYLNDLVVKDDALYLVTNYQFVPSGNPQQSIKDKYETKLDGYNPIIVKYSIDYGIETKNDGNGKVEVNTNAKAGDKVTFKVIPNEGYIIDNIKVTDIKGNVIDVVDYSFIMPSDDVIIDVTFKKDVINPNTIGISIIGLLIVSSIGALLLYKNGKKVIWMNR